MTKALAYTCRECGKRFLSQWERDGAIYCSKCAKRRAGGS